MASALHEIGPNFRVRFVKASGLRLSDVESRSTTDYADIICGDGAPSGGYGRHASATMVYLRKDASTAITAVYTTHNGGTTWTAVASAALGAGLTAIDGLIPAAGKAILFTGASTASLIDVSSAAQSILDDANVGAIRTTLGVGTGDSPTFAGVTANVTGNVSGSSGSCTGNAATATTAASATQLATAALHETAPTVATGAVQNPAHTIGAFPTKVWCEIVSGHDGAGATGDKVPTITWGSPKADGTNYNITVTAGATFVLHAIK